MRMPYNHNSMSDKIEAAQLKVCAIFDEFNLKIIAVISANLTV